jgi:hypothetical protein
MKNHLKLFVLAVFAVVSFVFVTASMAQSSTTGTVEGTVADANGAVVPNATITLSGPNLIRPLTTTADSSGNYRFLQVPPGRYTIETAAASGFAAYKQENIEVNLTKSSMLTLSQHLRSTRLPTLLVRASPRSSFQTFRRRVRFKASIRSPRRLHVRVCVMLPAVTVTPRLPVLRVRKTATSLTA